MWLLNWLVDRWSQVYNLVDAYYSSIISAAKYAYSWAVEKANSALSSARSYASGLYSAALNYAKDLFNQAESYAVALVDGARTLARSLYSSAVDLAESLYDQARAYVVDRYNALKAWAGPLIDAARQEAHDLFAEALDFAAYVLQQATAGAQALVNGLRDTLLALIDQVRGDVVNVQAAIGGGTTQGQANLMMWATNPIGSVAAVLQGILLDLLFWLLAVGMGRDGLDLGSPPVFSSSPGGGGSGGGSGGGGSVSGSPPGWLADLVGQYFPSSQVTNALNVSYLESGWNPNAINNTLNKAGGKCGVSYTLPDGRPALTELSVGLFQINVCVHGQSASYWQDPEHNVAKAASLYKQAGWKPWTYSAQKLGLL